ncbi:polysaccharide deacetylase family protein [Bacillus taeanensis]|uniref:polysaccharide deacetylase family protein n=1 Tax=Bacillus taeanensis TaxID=273032 RepID=UPI001FE62F45|nr:polysaccharide deacetylase family protein [Bacillus taeanensis]
MYDSTDADVITVGKPQKEKSVLLTFDDGPSKILPEILDVLHAESVPALFFWQSRLFYEDRPWKRLLSEGHEIGTHSMKHLNLTNLCYNKQYKDIAQSVKSIESIINQKITYFRPPFGQYNAETITAAKELGLTTVMWKIASMDWELKENPQEIIANVVENLEDGAIILLHELKQTLYVLPELIQEIKAKGYQFTTL